MASWVIVDIKTEKPVLETYSARMIEHLNTHRYKAIPIQEWLASINRRIKNESI